MPFLGDYDIFMCGRLLFAKSTNARIFIPNSQYSVSSNIAMYWTLPYASSQDAVSNSF